MSHTEDGYRSAERRRHPKPLPHVAIFALFTSRYVFDGRRHVIAQIFDDAGQLTWRSLPRIEIDSGGVCRCDVRLPGPTPPRGPPCFAAARSRPGRNPPPPPPPILLPLPL